MFNVLAFNDHEFSVVRGGSSTLPDFVPVVNEDREHIPWEDEDVIENGGFSYATLQVPIMVPIADRNVWKTTLNGIEAQLEWYFGETFQAVMKVSNGRFEINQDEAPVYYFDAEIIKVS